ncbi:MAG: hypothetical protein M1286_04505 [Candidatus Marsarchaeota archaeon]|nr:hypothetical protein [Candidatus Marsarchaeota archaeon]
MSRTAICVFLLLAISGLASAGTVTLNGECLVRNVSSNSIAFSLSNSGNDSAYSLVLTPVIQGSQSVVGAYTANLLGPLSNVTFALNFTNITERGEHPAYMLLAYQQGTSVFTATFPCVIPFGNTTVSKVLISSNVTPLSNGTFAIRVGAFNEGSQPVVANVLLALPPSFTYADQDSYHVDLAPYAVQNVTFVVTPPGYSSQASFGSAAFATYSLDNLSYTSMDPFTVVIAPPGALAGPILFYAAGAAIVAVLALILLSVWRRSRRPKA